jgi:hypothetical protein
MTEKTDRIAALATDLYASLGSATEAERRKIALDFTVKYIFDASAPSTAWRSSLDEVENICRIASASRSITKERL